MSVQDFNLNNVYKTLVKEYPDLSTDAIETALQFKEVATKLQTEREEMFNRYNITSGRFHLLLILRSEEGFCLSPSELAKRTNVTRATMTQFIDALEKDGYVRRTDDPKDRRAMLVQLTDKGMTKIQEILPHYFSSLTNFTKSFSNEERNSFLSLMDKLELNYAR